MNRIIKHKVQIPLYRSHLIIICADDIEEVAKKYKVEGVSRDLYDAYVFRYKGNYVYVQEPSVTYGVIAHEAKHIVNYLFADTGVKLDVENDEAECYLLGWLVDKIYEMINKK